MWTSYNHFNQAWSSSVFEFTEHGRTSKEMDMARVLFVLFAMMVSTVRSEIDNIAIINGLEKMVEEVEDFADGNSRNSEMQLNDPAGAASLYCRAKHTTPWAGEEYTREVWYLDRHIMQCDGKQVINRFKMGVASASSNIPVGPGLNVRYANAMQYVYTCCQVEPTQSASSLTCDAHDTYRSTGLNNAGEGAFVYLDRHNVDCGTGGFIQSFKLDRGGTTNQMQYLYTCCKTTKNHSCKVHHTTWNWGKDNKWSSYVLQRHDVACGSTGYALSQFKLHRDASQTRVQYSFRCCKIN